MHQSCQEKNFHLFEKQKQKDSNWQDGVPKIAGTAALQNRLGKLRHLPNAKLVLTRRRVNSTTISPQYGFLSSGLVCYVQTYVII